MDTTSWWLDEAGFAGPEHLDEAYVAGYETKAGYDPAADVAAVLAAGIGPDSVVVDAGAGTGAFTRAIAPHVGRVIALDVSPAMVAALRSGITASGLNNVEVVTAGFLSWAPDGPQVDAIFSRNALHQLPDFWKGIALSRLHGALVPGGLLRLLDLVYDFEPHEAPERMAAWMAAAVDDPARGYTAPEFAAHARTEFGTYSWLLDALIEHAGFEIIERDVRLGIYATYTARRSSLGQRLLTRH